ncbi:GNAT family N-acetyltransferase [Dactylosporangium sp. AC04546]|uniref:GNAT family N-acetyltransferase n=1 Tax=Dactylosporangium sp. AC04546 TaxID=2862460 RepID=UPI002714DA34|nr:GNAT family N-acetyltransferase [Dactylosporangium sp. AC04546]WVK85528.1 GNAT family N-acetyltransferase [Dactylosporangium sp. AC04546]
MESVLPSPDLRTDRLVLRRWAEADRAPFAAMNADPEVMRYFPRPLTPGESDALVDRIEQQFAEHGYGLWAVSTVDDPFIGFVGLMWQRIDAPWAPALEIGWRLARHAWGRGYATEAAVAARDFAFRPREEGGAGMADIVSMTTVTNTPSQAVMRKIGMTRDPADDFRHPSLPVGHPLERHVLYRLHRPAAA